ncbi:MAG: PEP/pyruvate-binding domain-containing protein, partial [Candidatus Aenigmatarchaeota archaeon]
MKLVVPLAKARKKDVRLVGGKNANLGELISIGMPVPLGFAVTAGAYWHFIHYNKLDGQIKLILKKTNVKKIRQLRKAGKQIRFLIRNGKFPKDLEKEIMMNYRKMKLGRVAVRSSATAEDLKTASFAGQQQSFLNVREKDLLKKIKSCFASLFTDRAISYRQDKGFNQFKIALSVGVHSMIAADASGVLFTIEPDSGHRGYVYINGGWGIGDYIVQGVITPDEFLIFKKGNGVLIEKNKGVQRIMEVRSPRGVRSMLVPRTKLHKFVITDNDVQALYKHAMKIEKHYKTPMDIEWAKSGGKIYILQARPETVHVTHASDNVVKHFCLKEKSAVLAVGGSVGRAIASGKANVILNPKQIGKFKAGDILVTKMTDPDWEPVMKKAAGIVTDLGGRTSHAAIVSREMGIPAIIGTGNATKTVHGYV